MKARSAGGTYKNSKQTFEALVSCSPLAIIAVDPAGNVIAWNPAAERIFGWKAQEVVGGPNPIVPPEKQKEFRSLLKSILAGEACSDVETTRKRKDGSDIEVKISASPVFHARGGIVGAMAVVSDITEQKRAEEALRKSEKKYKDLFDSAIDGIYHADASGIFTMMNTAGAQIFGYDSPDKIIGRSVLEYWRDPKDRDTFVAELKAKRSLGSYPVPARKKDGEPIELESTSRIIEDEKGNLLGIEGILRDVTEHMQADRHLQQLLERATALYEGSSDMTESLEVQELAGSVTRACVDKFGVTIAWIGRAEGDGSVSHVAHFPPQSSYPKRISARWDDTPSGRGSTGRAIRGGQPVAISDISRDEGLAPLHDAARKEGIVSLAAFPLISRGRTYGVLELYSDKPGFFTEEYTQFFQIYAHQAAAAIENARLFQETEDNLEHLRALRAIDLAITSSLDLRVTLDVLLDNVTSQLKADAAALLLLNPHSKLLEYAAGRGFRTRALQHTRLQIGQGYAGQAVTEQRAIKVPNVMEAEGFTRAPMLKPEGFVSYFGVPLVAKGHVKGVLEIFHRKLLNPDEQWFEFLDALAGQAAIAIDNAALFNALERSNVELTMAYETTLDGWSRALDLRDKETEGHTQRVAEMTLRLAKAIGMSDEELVHLRRGALLHDIGKMGVPDSILLKPGKLTDEEWDIMRKHPVFAYELIYPITYLRNAVDIPYCHHEKWDGTGYPRGLKGEQIPLAARVFAVMDVWDALRSDRPYRPAWPEEKTLEHIRALSGSHFDPRVVDIFLKIQW
ncbi:MAG: PAS domain S-box protein [Nitrospiraceae bacterium]|nr:PAS domain S-box protein [Nitrospiraceae bacterium]